MEFAWTASADNGAREVSYLRAIARVPEIMSITIEQHRRLHLLLRFVMLFGIGVMLYLTQPPGIWGLIGFLAMGLMTFVGATVIAMRIPARCALDPGCDGPSRLRHLEGHHWYVCERCGDRQDGGSQQMDSGT